MHRFSLATAVLIGLPIVAHAQTTRPGVDDITPASPIVRTHAVSPTLPSPRRLSRDDLASDYLRAAYAALAQGRTGLARQSLEMAETREMGGEVARGVVPGDDQRVARIRGALHSLGAGDRRQAREYIKLALLR